MPELLIAALFGLFGGIARSTVGTMKALRRGKKFRLKYFLFTVIESGIIGIIVGLLYPGDPKIALAAGYAGTDVLEGFYKLRK